MLVSVSSKEKTVILNISLNFLRKYDSKMNTKIKETEGMVSFKGDIQSHDTHRPPLTVGLGQ